VTWLSGQVDFYENIDANVSITIVEGQVLNIEEQIISEFGMYPNPASDIIQFSGSLEAGSEVLIYDITGKQILQTHINSNNRGVDVSHLPSGFYITKLITNSRIVSIKLIID